MKSNYDRSVSLLCPTCAATAFSFDETQPKETRVYLCNGCGNAASHADIMDSNAERLSEAVEELKSELISDISDGLKKALKGK